MTDPAVLILTQAEDPTAGLVAAELDRRGVAWARVDPAGFPLDVTLDAGCDGAGWRGWLTPTAGAPIRLEALRGIWYRRPTRFRFAEHLAGQERGFVAREAEYGFGGVLRSLPCRWVNHPDRSAVANQKPYQLALAARAGLRVPRTLVTNDPEAVRRFAASGAGGIIYKTMSGGPIITPDGVRRPIYTTPIEVDDSHTLSAVRHTAHLFQENVPKRVELRVVAVGERLFAAEIDSQRSPTTAQDWRRGCGDLRHRHHDLPAGVAGALRAMMRELGLAFGAFDLILTPDDEYVFLEVNANGQWGWLEDDPGLPIAAALADLLSASVAPRMAAA